MSNDHQKMRWATLSVSIQDIAEDNKVLVRDLSAYDPKETIPLLAGLLTLPEYQSQCVRLEVLVALAVTFCKGLKMAEISDAVRWFSEIEKSQCVVGEAPAKDVFVSLVHDRNGNYRLIEGIWETAGFYTQRILEVVSTMFDDGKFRQIKKSFHALLVISDMVCERAGLRRYQLGSDEPHSTLSPEKIPILWKEIDSQCFAEFTFEIEIDRGYYISYLFFLPSVEIHANGRFKHTYQDEGTLTDELQKTIDDTSK